MIFTVVEIPDAKGSFQSQVLEIPCRERFIWYMPFSCVCQVDSAENRAILIRRGKSRYMRFLEKIII